MKITLTYELTVEYVVNLDASKIESISVQKQSGSQIAGFEGFIHADSDTKPFQRSDVKLAVEILKTTKDRPKWQIKEIVKEK